MYRTRKSFLSILFPQITKIHIHANIPNNIIITAVKNASLKYSNFSFQKDFTVWEELVQDN